MQNTGDISYAVNTNSLNSLFTQSYFTFAVVYLFVAFLSILYLIQIRCVQYSFPNGRVNKNVVYMFKSLTYQSLLLSRWDGSNQRIAGLSHVSYLVLIGAYLVALLLLAEGLIQNLMYSVYVGVIQMNPNNNPYNNATCITKINENPSVSVSANYGTMVSMALLFLVPFFIQLFMSWMNIDNYDIKHSFWISYAILFLLISPLVGVIIYRANLNVFSGLQRFLSGTKDGTFISNVRANVMREYFIVFPFLFVFLMYIYFMGVLAEERWGILRTRIIAYLIAGALLVFFVPTILGCLGLSQLFRGAGNDGETIDSMQKEGAKDLYELLVRYNYPCFKN